MRSLASYSVLRRRSRITHIASRGWRGGFAGFLHNAACLRGACVEDPFRFRLRTTCPASGFFMRSSSIPQLESSRQTGAVPGRRVARQTDTPRAERHIRHLRWNSRIRRKAGLGVTWAEFRLEPMDKNCPLLGGPDASCRTIAPAPRTLERSNITDM
jgi:hypothetical protein